MAPMVLGTQNGDMTLVQTREFLLPRLAYALPWSVIMVGDTAGQLIDSDMIVNLNPKADKASFD